MMIQKATERRSARAAHEAGGRGKGGGAGAPPPNDDSEGARKAKHSRLSAGQRPASKEGVVRRRPPAQHYSIMIASNHSYTPHLPITRLRQIICVQIIYIYRS